LGEKSTASNITSLLWIPKQPQVTIGGGGHHDQPQENLEVEETAGTSHEVIPMRGDPELIMSGRTDAL